LFKNYGYSALTSLCEWAMRKANGWLSSLSSPHLSLLRARKSAIAYTRQNFRYFCSCCLYISFYL